MLVTFLPWNLKLEVQAGDNLLQVASEAGIDLNGVCAGNGTCGKCRVIISKGNDSAYTKHEIRILSEDELKRGMRLACCVTINHDICVLVDSQQKKILKQEVEDKPIVLRQVASNSELGIAFDIGTTCVEGTLYDIQSKEVLCNIEVDNPQRIYGADVISRLTYIHNKEDGLSKLHAHIIDCCNDMIEQMIRKSQTNLDMVKTIAVAGNTTMSYVFAGEDIKPLMISPFQLEFKGGVIRKAKELGMECNPHTKVLLPKLIGGHVGSDTLGCILETKVYEKKGIYLIVDVGTNGEIVLSNNGTMSACSTAAGPAFEGASILHGMKAVSGAIYEAALQNGRLTYKTIENARPKGICGSGLIDLVAELIRCHVIDETGRMLEDYIIASNPDGTNIRLVQKDIRELQLAKAAIYTGIRVLLRNSNVKVEDLDGMYIAGSFGSHLNMKNAVKVGLFPDVVKERVQCIGNASLRGMSKLITREIEFDRANEIGESITHIELANREEFTEEYMNWINFTK